MTLAIRSFVTEHEQLDAAAVDAFLAAHQSPIVEGDAVTFLFRGEAGAVRLRHFIMGFPSLQPFRRIDGTDLWYLTMDVPRGSRIEYKLEVRRKRRTRLVLDPLNTHTARDPFGRNSVCYASGYERREMALSIHDGEAVTLRVEFEREPAAK